MGAKISADLTHTKTDFTAGRSVSALLLQQYKSGSLFQFCSLENTGKNELMIPSILILTAAPILVSFFTRRTYLKGKQAISGSGFRLAEKYVLVL